MNDGFEVDGARDKNGGMACRMTLGVTNGACNKPRSQLRLQENRSAKQYGYEQRWPAIDLRAHFNSEGPQSG